LKFHYIFNLRDLSRIYEGLCRSTLDKFNTKDSFIRLWRNEVTRVFVDRLITDEDKLLITGTEIPGLIREHFGDSFENVMVDPMLFGDYMTATPLDSDVVDPRLYEDCGSFDKVSVKFNSLLSEYNEERKEMNLVLFKDALEHLTKIHRILRFPMGHALLVGFGGSGK
jgi:dynein heavy chain